MIRVILPFTIPWSRRWRKGAVIFFLDVTHGHIPGGAGCKSPTSGTICSVYHYVLFMCISLHLANAPPCQMTSDLHVPSPGSFRCQEDTKRSAKRMFTQLQWFQRLDGTDTQKCPLYGLSNKPPTSSDCQKFCPSTLKPLYI